MRWAAVSAHVLASAILMALTVALLRRPLNTQEGAAGDGADGGAGRPVRGGGVSNGCSGDDGDVFFGCPSECHGVGTCSENRTCACDTGYHGADCARLWCPKGCSGRGMGLYKPNPSETHKLETRLVIDINP